MARKRTKPTVGDVFRIPISEMHSGFGQILAKYYEEMLLMVIFNIKTQLDELPPLTAIVGSKPLFIANSMDAKIDHGNWVVVGNVPPDYRALPLPKYKVQIGDTMYAVSFDDKRKRPAAASELDRLSFRNCFRVVFLFS